MRFSTVVLLATVGGAHSAGAFVASHPYHHISATTAFLSSIDASQSDQSDANCDAKFDRRSFLQRLGAFAATTAFSPVVASAGLLDEFGSDPTKINSNPPPTKESDVPKIKVESSMEPNLRSNYYYPTNKKRYLPRIKRCNDAIPGAAVSIGENNWEDVESFAIKIADDTILPMKLYTSSLLGGGTNVKVSFAKDMTQAAIDFEKSQKKLLKSIKKQDQSASSAALEDLASALLAYRTACKLLGPDGGGDIPSVDEIRRSACRVQGRTFDKKIKDRDTRLKEAGAVPK